MARGPVPPEEQVETFQTRIKVEFRKCKQSGRRSVCEGVPETSQLRKLSKEE